MTETEYKRTRVKDARLNRPVAASRLPGRHHFWPTASVSLASVGRNQLRVTKHGLSPDRIVGIGAPCRFDLLLRHSGQPLPPSASTRTQAQVFPTGLYKNTGQQYDCDVTFPITGDNANPSLPERTDRNP